MRTISDGLGKWAKRHRCPTGSTRTSYAGGSDVRPVGDAIVSAMPQTARFAMSTRSKKLTPRISRTPPPRVLQELRTEVGFGCPVPNCRQALLTWHHFDPPWKTEQHHRPAGMIALCQRHHSLADSGWQSKEYFRKLKISAAKTRHVTTELPPADREYLIRLGGCYSGGTRVPVAVAGRPTIWLRRTNAGLLLSFRLYAKDDSLLVSVTDNMFDADSSRLHDLTANASGTKVKVWLAERDIGLHLSFSRVTMEELAGLIEGDCKRAAKKVAPILMEAASGLPAFIAEVFPKVTMPDNVRRDVMGWALTHVDADQKIQLVNFDRLCLWKGNQRIAINNGITMGKGGVFYSALMGAQVGINL